LIRVPSAVFLTPAVCGAAGVDSGCLHETPADRRHRRSSIRPPKWPIRSIPFRPAGRRTHPESGAEIPMATVKRLSDLRSYTEVLPYASELFGIYQPLLGWKSKRIAERFNSGFDRDKSALLDRLKSQFAADFTVAYADDCGVKIDLQPGVAASHAFRRFDSVLLQELAKHVPAITEADPAAWKKAISPGTVKKAFADAVVPALTDFYEKNCKGTQPPRFAAATRRVLEGDKDRMLFRAAFERQLHYESTVAGALLFLVDNKAVDALATVFYSSKDNSGRAEQLVSVLAAANVVDAYLDINTLDPGDKAELQRVSLSPISVVHLFRQYFFELDSFLGTPVGHVWLSPGSTVELVEVQTRRTIVEKTLEQSLESKLETVSETVDEEEISEAVKEDNKRDISFGASVSATYAGIIATSSFDYNRSQQTSREETHKRTRSQTEKLSSEIRRNYKSTFKTVSETVDTSSKRYIMSNTTDELLNYELRRKMRQVAVQVQDVGSYLCWQTYVDRPGESLGVAKLMHIAKPADLDGLHAPEEIPMLQPFTEDKVVSIPFEPIEGIDSDKDEVYEDGIEVDNTEGIFGTPGTLEKIRADFPIDCVCPKGGYVLANVEFEPPATLFMVSRRGAIQNSDNRSRFTLHLDRVNFQDQDVVQVALTLHWTPAPGANDEAIEKNKANTEAFKAQEAAAYQKAFIENARNRVKLTHEIERRPSDDLREEERIVVYRKLIQEMLTNGVTMPDDSTRHVVAELINSIFDVEKMLYFVAPEWWRPRLRDHVQQLGARPSKPGRVVAELDALTNGMTKRLFGVSDALNSNPDPIAANTVGWGGVDDPNRDNYFITEDSEPARFGSSLGWLMQLDGDNMRNAFLNAPWVKAVIPIRPGKEEAAINWLKGVEGFNGIEAGDIYQTSNADEKDISGNPLNGQKMIDVIVDLARKIKRKHEEGIKNGTFPKQDEVANPELVDADNVVTSTPIDRVYEHGFYPLRGGFRANISADYEIFDQWLEILPTDQVVPVEVRYDPKTGRQL
jgi:hypothetical protein